jgi:glutamyl-tRNA synthetase
MTFIKSNEQKNKAVRVRFAPSPTGFMHIGNFRSALYDYLFAKKHEGKFILRIEDTDQKRFVEGAVESLVTSLKEMGINWDEGVYLNQDQLAGDVNKVESLNYPGIIEAGDCGPYIQSERLEVYTKYAQQLIQEGKAYYCFCEPERLEKMRKQQMKEKQAPMYDRFCLRNLTPEQINQKLAQNCPATIRLKVPENQTIEFQDVVRGKVSFNTNNIDDQVLIKSDGFPTYHLANVVDDHLMGVTHVIRGEEWLPSTPKHILLYQAFGWEVPTFGHLPLLLNPDKTKLSKRQGDVALEDYLKKGYLKEALINFVALLGWNPGEGSTQEIFTLDELVEKFELSKVHKAGAVFDVKKLDWINGQYIKKLDIDQLYAYTMPYLEKKELYFGAPGYVQNEDYIKKVLKVEQERLNKLDDVGDADPYLFGSIKYDKQLLVWKDMSHEELKASLMKSLTVLEGINEQEWSLENLEKKLLEAAGEKRGDLLWPLRASLTGAQKSPSPFEVAWVLGQEESIKRIKDALAKL